MKLQNNPEIHMNDEFLAKVRYLCAHISKNEWNGILFYSIKEGDIENPSTLVLEAVDIHPMKKGSGTHVGFNYEDSWIDVFDNKEHLEDYKMGVIHSHVSMNSFHSPTDMNDLEENCGHYDFYLSVVTNNNLDFDIKIAIEAERKVEKKVTTNSFFKFKDSFGKWINKNFKDEEDKEETEEVMLVYEVDAVAPTKPDNEDEIFKNRVQEIIDEYNTPKKSFDNFPIQELNQTFGGYLDNQTDKFNLTENNNTDKSHTLIIELISEVFDRIDDVDVKTNHNIVDLFSDFIENKHGLLGIEEELAETFMSHFLDIVEDSTYNEKDIINEFIDYLGFFSYSLIQNEMLRLAEVHLKNIKTKKYE